MPRIRQDERTSVAAATGSIALRATSRTLPGLERIAAHFTLDGQVTAYLGWYEELLDEWRG